VIEPRSPKVRVALAAVRREVEAAPVCDERLEALDFLGNLERAIVRLDERIDRDAATTQPIEVGR